MGIDVNIYKLKVGDKVVVTERGQTHTMTVHHISPAGSMGRRESAGPSIGAWIRPGGYGLFFDYSTTGVDVQPHTEGGRITDPQKESTP